ncbi:MAG: filamentous hemagglutinin N-terminal domain-containing protein, partial [Desulfamplus sp.]
MNSKHLTNLAAMLFSSIFFLTSPALLFADISTDGSVGAAQTLTGPNYAIPETLGTLKGSNLFHSFDKFSIKTEESATFTGSDSIKNVLSRVTGGEKSEINGTLRSNVGKADFYFINPSGVVFGENAKVDVPAAFHASTGNQLKFQDGSSFKASKSEQSTLTQAAPEAFGFLGTQPVNIKVDGDNIQNKGSIEINGSTLEFQPESKVSLTSSKDIAIKGIEKETSIEEETKQASLTSYGGEVELKAGGDLLLDNASVDTSGNGGGKIDVTASSIKLHNQSKIAADNRGDKNVDGNGVEVKADKDVEIRQGSRIQSNVFGSGDSGKIKVEAENMLIKQEGEEGLTGILIEVEKEATGNGQTVEVNIKGNLNIQGVSGIASSTSGFGDSASVNVHAGLFKMDGEGRSIPYRDTYYNAGIASNGLQGSSGDTNEVSVYVDTLLEMVNGCGISAHSYGIGDGSSVNIKAGEIKIDGSNSNGNFTGIATSSASEGKSIETDIEVDGNFELINGAQIFTSTFSDGNSGSVNIKSKNLTIDGKGNTEQATGIMTDTYYGKGHAGQIDIDISENLKLLNGALISSSTLWSQGDGGTININAAEMFEILNGSEISSYAWGDSEGNAGDIKITAEEMTMGNTEDIELLTAISNSAYQFSKGDSGNIEIIVSGFLNLLQSANISNSVYSQGNGGDIVIKAGRFKADSNGRNTQQTSILSQSSLDATTANSGNITIDVTGLFELLNGAQISTITKSEGKSGNVKITADTMLLDSYVDSQNSTAIYTNAVYSTGDAGNIDIIVSDLLKLNNGADISSSTYSEGDGGNVFINAGQLKIDNLGKYLEDKYTGIFTDANISSKGNAGMVKIVVKDLLEIINGGQISSNTWSQGDANYVQINAGNIRIDNIDSNSEQYTGIMSDAKRDSQGNAGTVEIRVSELIELLNGSQVSTNAKSTGNAGNVIVNAENIKIENGSKILSDTRFSTGDAGTIIITVSNLLVLLNNAQISTATYSEGDAGEIKINAGNLRIDNNNEIINAKFTGIWSDAYPSSQGAAGSVDVTVSGLLELLNEGQISSDTYGEGDAGEVIVNADDIIMKNWGYIGSAAYKNSKGYVGNIKINADSIKLTDNSMISIEALQTLAEDKLAELYDNGTIYLNTKLITLNNKSAITSGSWYNAPASDINIEADVIVLKNSVITTSADGENGDGGNIQITGIKQDGQYGNSADFLVMQGGFIQANAAAKNAKGGLIDIDIKGVIADKSQELKIGGQVREEFVTDKNVIQSAAPDGYPGDINISGVELDIGGSIINASSQFSTQA